VAQLYARLLAVRRRLAPGDADEIEFDDEAQWLRVCQGAFEVICNFSSGRRRIECKGTHVELASGDEPSLADGRVELEPMSGALIS
jgi:hypothetical protein